MKNKDWFIMWIAWLTILAMQFTILYQVVHHDDHPRVSATTQTFRI